MSGNAPGNATLGATGLRCMRTSPLENELCAPNAAGKEYKKKSTGLLRCSLARTLPQVLRQTCNQHYCSGLSLALAGWLTL